MHVAAQCSHDHDDCDEEPGRIIGWAASAPISRSHARFSSWLARCSRTGANTRKWARITLTGEPEGPLRQLVSGLQLHGFNETGLTFGSGTRNQFAATAGLPRGHQPYRWPRIVLSFPPDAKYLSDHISSSSFVVLTSTRTGTSCPFTLLTRR